MNEWSNPVPTDPRDNLDQDQILLQWTNLKAALTAAKDAEMEMRKYIVKRAFPNPEEGTNTLDLGNGYQLKAAIKYNYKLDSDNDRIWSALDEIKAVGNEGSFIADRLVSWTPNFLLTEYRTLTENGDPSSIKILEIINRVLTITEAAPSLDIKEPKKNKK